MNETLRPRRCENRNSELQDEPMSCSCQRPTGDQRRHPEAPTTRRGHSRAASAINRLTRRFVGETVAFTSRRPTHRMRFHLHRTESGDAGSFLARCCDIATKQFVKARTFPFGNRLAAIHRHAPMPLRGRRGRVPRRLRNNIHRHDRPTRSNDPSYEVRQTQTPGIRRKQVGVISGLVARARGRRPAGAGR